MAKVKTAIGSNLYLFHGTSTNPTGYAPQCCISSHGWYKNDSADYDPPTGITLKFYCDHGSTVDDMMNFKAWRKVATGGIKQTATHGTPGGTCKDYILGKLQQSHGEIKKFGEDQKKKGESGWTGLTDDQLYAKAEDHLSGLADFVAEVPGNYLNLLELSDDTFDIITIRNRKYPWMSNTPKLSAVISAIEAVHSYGTYACAFCRELKT